MIKVAKEFLKNNLFLAAKNKSKGRNDYKTQASGKDIAKFLKNDKFFLAGKKNNKSGDKTQASGKDIKWLKENAYTVQNWLK